MHQRKGYSREFFVQKSTKVVPLPHKDKIYVSSAHTTIK